MTKPNQSQKREQWKNLVEAQQASDLSQKEFCRQHNLVLSQFVYYRSQLKITPTATESSFTPVKVTTNSSVTSSTDIKLVLPNGFQCVFSSGIEASQVKRLVEALLSC
tara:strand:- start:577 stop:900 length:324 start_codon:yes stop_codon:yes gene_type:complete